MLSFAEQLMLDCCSVSQARQKQVNFGLIRSLVNWFWKHGTDVPQRIVSISHVFVVIIVQINRSTAQLL
jgi:hypothetical protein